MKYRLGLGCTSRAFRSLATQSFLEAWEGSKPYSMPVVPSVKLPAP